MSRHCDVRRREDFLGPGTDGLQEGRRGADDETRVDCRAVGLMTVAFAACASTSPSNAERARTARVWIVNDKEVVRGCQPIIDDDMQDLQKNALRLGGDVALVTLQSLGSRGAFGTYGGGVRSRTYTTAEICRCKGAR